MLTPSLACGKDQSPGISTHPAHGPLTRLCFPGGAKEQMPESSSREHTFPLDRAVKGAAAKVLSLNLSHPEAGRQAPQGDTEYPGPPHPCAAPGARRSSPVCRSHPRGTGSTHPCKYHELPERKKSTPFGGAQRAYSCPSMLQIALLYGEQMLLSIQKELLQIWALFLPLPPITGSGQCCAACQRKKKK